MKIARVRRSTFLLAWLTVTLAVPVGAQHEDHSSHSPYAGLQTAEGTSLTAEEIASLRAGDGMRLALPAELNGYPGPLHVLELEEELGLTGEQRHRIEQIRERMLTRARGLGEEIIMIERHLSGIFRSEEATAESLVRITRHLSEKRGALQAVHLEAHIETRRVLEPVQIEAYVRARGYGSNSGG